MKHRRLTWFYHSGTATVRGNFKQKPIDMLVTTTQAAVLLLFNSGVQPPRVSETTSLMLAFQVLRKSKIHLIISLSL